MASWFAPADPDALNLRYGQLMHVMTTGRAALVSSLATIAPVAAIAALWHDATTIAIFAVVATALAVISDLFYRRAAAYAAAPDGYRRANVRYVAHSFFVVASMAAVGLLWIPGAFAPNIFVLLVLIVCAAVRAAHQAAHTPSAAMSLIYILIGIALLLSEPTTMNVSLGVLGLSVTAMLIDVNWRMYSTVERMLKLSQSERALLSDQARLLHELRVANEAKSDFMARMSHELRTPLNAVIGFSEVMMRQTMGPLGAPVYLDYLKDIHSSGAHLLHLINDILDLSKIEAGRFDLREGEVDPCESVEDAMAMVRLRAMEGGVALRDETPAGVMLSGDALAVRQILVNLLSNAVKFTPAGGSVSCQGAMTADGGFEFRIEDTGHGIPPEDLEFVFEPFGQSVSGYQARERGTGLGLPIVRRLMSLHGGTARIESTVGRGTVAVVTFPASRVRTSDVRAAA